MGMRSLKMPSCEIARDRIQRIVLENRNGKAVGVWSVCSAHPWVLEAAMAQGLEDGSPVLIESTSNQVNQLGGYTGMTPKDFAQLVRAIAKQVGLPQEQLVLGGDHLGPYPWRKLPADIAMLHARNMVREYVLAGFVKVHLDASMPCASDPGPALDPELAAQRSAQLCQEAEKAWGELPEGSPAPLYVIGTEVPVPGGEQLDSGRPRVTLVEDAQAAIETHRKAFYQLGLQDAFERVIGLVVQPGVEFGSEIIFDYDRRQARILSTNLPKSPLLVYEAHSTDYQTTASLQALVEDHFAILKVGPALTFGMREAIFALCALEQEWLEGTGIAPSRVRDALEQAMVDNPAHWRDYYTGEECRVRLQRKYSYSDRCRYYWPVASVREQLDVLIGNLREAPPPLTLISQFMPEQYAAVRAGVLANDPVQLIQDRVRQVLRCYAVACGSRAHA